MRRINIFLALLYLAAWTGIAAKSEIVISGRGRNPVGPHLESLRDEKGQFSIEQVSSTGFLDRFIKLEREVPNFGYTNDVYWFKFRIRNPTYVSTEWLLEAGYPLLDEIQLFILDENGHFLASKVAGRAHPVAIREIRNRNFLFRVPLPAMSAVTLYLRVHTEGSLNLPLVLWSPESFARKDHDTQFIFGLYYGLITVLVFYNLFLFFALRDRNYFYYSLTLIFIHGFLQFSVNGIASEYSLFAERWWIKEAIVFFGTVGGFCGLLFSRSFLNTRINTPVLHKILNGLMAGNLIAALSSPFLPYRVAIISSVALLLSSGFFVWLAGIISWRVNYRPARYYLLAWLILLAGGVIYNLKAFGYIPSNIFTEYSGQMGLSLEAVLLSLGLSDRFNILRQDKYRAQRRALEQERLAHIAQSELLDHLEQMEKLKEDFMAIEETGQSIDSLLEKILDAMQRILQFENGFISVVDRFNRVLWKERGLIPAYLKTFMTRAHLLYRRFNAPEEFFEEMNVIINLEAGRQTPLDEESKIAKNFPHNARTIREILERMKKDRLGILVPLSYRKEIIGFVIAGRKQKGDYTEGEIKTLETFRLSIAQAIRNAILYDEISMLKGKAEDKATKLSDYIIGVNRAIEHTMKEKTLVYTSEKMANVFDQARKFSNKNQPILITGETGTGKDLIANMIHEENSGKTGPFVAVNCAAIPGNLWESEIFGHVKGAFTDAKSDHPGKIEQAAGGTLFFDEIGEMPLEVQPKLLRLLQERKFQRVGGDKLLSAECRFIFATNRSLADLQQKGQFREDLFYRISVFQILIPSLRERREDIPVLARYFLEKYAKELHPSVSGIDEEAMEALYKFKWPGNIRELENCLIQAIVNCQAKSIRIEDLPRYITDQRIALSRNTEIKYESTRSSDTRNFDEMVADYSRKLIENAMQKAEGNKVEAAKMLGIKRATFYYKLKELGIN